MPLSRPPRVADHSDFRQYLRAVYDWERGFNAAVTLERFAARCGMSASALKAILAGRRNLTIANIHATASALKMTWTERASFEALVLMSQAPDADSRAYYRRRLRATTKTAKAKKGRVRVPDSKLVSGWYVPALLVYLIDGTGVGSDGAIVLDRVDRQRLADAFGIGIGELERTLALVSDLEIIRRGDDESVHIVYDRLTGRATQREYLGKVFEALARRLASRFDDPQSYFASYAMTLSEAKYCDFREELIELLDRYVATGGEGPLRQVFQLGIQMSPLVPLA